ncbi:MAG TPA: cation:dicarboxylase symporter family transporter [Terracidiphilus sp.]|nr:cation:dicarboxylase symporter family transporter [Terracidiphilus sp.]
MVTSTTTRSASQNASARLLLPAGAVFLAAGILLGFIHTSAIGISLRWIGIAAFLVSTIRKSSLMTWTFLAMLAGVELGIDAPHIAAQVRLPGDLFLRLIRMIVAPLLFATITTGIAGHSELKSVGRVAIKALILFEVVTTLGLIIGVVAMNLSGAGWGVVVPAALEGAPPAGAPAPQNWQEIVLNLFPSNIAEAVAQNQILQVAIFSILFGAALAMISEQKRAPLVNVLQSLAEVMFQLTRFIMYLAPLAAGAAIAYTVGNTGIATLLPLVKLVGTYYVALTAFVLLVLVPTLMLFRVPVVKFISAIGEPAALGFATTSSEAALPLAMERMEEFGVPRWIVSFVIPTGYSFNMTGGSVYLSMAAIFVAQAASMHLSFGRQLAIVLVLMAASKGIAGVPRASLVVLLATASAVNLPTAPILLILGVDTLMDMGRTMMNVVGNCMAAAVVGQTETSVTAS